MNGFRLECHRCEATWELGQHVSLYERHVHEGIACPHCGTLTLHCREYTVPAPKPVRRSLVRVTTPVAPRNLSAS